MATVNVSIERSYAARVAMCLRGEAKPTHDTAFADYLIRLADQIDAGIKAPSKSRFGTRAPTT